MYIYILPRRNVYIFLCEFKQCRQEWPLFNHGFARWHHGRCSLNECCTGHEIHRCRDVECHSRSSLERECKGVFFGSWSVFFYALIASRGGAAIMNGLLEATLAVLRLIVDFSGWGFPVFQNCLCRDDEECIDLIFVLEAQCESLFFVTSRWGEVVKRCLHFLITGLALLLTGLHLLHNIIKSISDCFPDRFGDGSPRPLGMQRLHQSNVFAAPILGTPWRMPCRQHPDERKANKPSWALHGCHLRMPRVWDLSGLGRNKICGGDQVETWWDTHAVGKKSQRQNGKAECHLTSLLRGSGYWM